MADVWNVVYNNNVDNSVLAPLTERNTGKGQTATETTNLVVDIPQGVSGIWWHTVHDESWRGTMAVACLQTRIFMKSP